MFVCFLRGFISQSKGRHEENRESRRIQSSNDVSARLPVNCHQRLLLMAAMIVPPESTVFMVMVHVVASMVPMRVVPMRVVPVMPFRVIKPCMILLCQLIVRSWSSAMIFVAAMIAKAATDCTMFSSPSRRRKTQRNGCNKHKQDLSENSLHV